MLWHLLVSAAAYSKQDSVLLFYFKSFHIRDIRLLLNYHANTCQQVAPIEISVKNKLIYSKQTSLYAFVSVKCIHTGN